MKAKRRTLNVKFHVVSKFARQNGLRVVRCQHLEQVSWPVCGKLGSFAVSNEYLGR